jgi:hypothetical protein
MMLQARWEWSAARLSDGSIIRNDRDGVRWATVW